MAAREGTFWFAEPRSDTNSRSEFDREFAEIAAARLDPSAFAPLYERYVDLVWRYALSRLGDSHLAADATSMTFQRALAALPKYRPRRRGESTTFRSWLMTIARNVVIDEARRMEPMASVDEPTLSHWFTDQTPGPEALALADDDRRRVRTALARLPEIPRQIVELHMIGMSGKEIGAMLGMSESAVKTAYHRAIVKLRDFLADTDTNGESL